MSTRHATLQPLYVAAKVKVIIAGRVEVELHDFISKLVDGGKHNMGIKHLSTNCITTGWKYKLITETL